jgi:hypothetical protein
MVRHFHAVTLADHLGSLTYTLFVAVSRSQHKLSCWRGRGRGVRIAARGESSCTPSNFATDYREEEARPAQSAGARAAKARMPGGKRRAGENSICSGEHAAVQPVEIACVPWRDVLMR